MSALETLEIVFSANMDGADRAIAALQKSLKETGRAAGNAGKIFEAAGTGMSGSLAAGFAAGGAALRAEAERASSAAAEALRYGDGGFRSAGEALSSAFSRALSGGADRASEAARTVAASARFSGSEGRARAAGQQLSEGFAAGIRDRAPSAISAAAALAQAAAKKLRQVLSIRSPSRVAMALGAYFSEGFARGVEDAADRAAQAASQLARAATQGASGAEAESGFARAAGGAPFTSQEAPREETVVVPLVVDGIKLGEAAIRGINRVTRATGRLSLEI